MNKKHTQTAETPTYAGLRATTCALGGRRRLDVHIPKHGPNTLRARKRALDSLEALHKEAGLPHKALLMAARHSISDNVIVHIVHCVRKHKIVWQACGVTTTDNLWVEGSPLEKHKRAADALNTLRQALCPKPVVTRRKRHMALAT